MSADDAGATSGLQPGPVRHVPVESKLKTIYNYRLITICIIITRKRVGIQRHGNAPNCLKLLNFTLALGHVRSADRPVLRISDSRTAVLPEGRETARLRPCDRQLRARCSIRPCFLVDVGSPELSRTHCPN